MIAKSAFVFRRTGGVARSFAGTCCLILSDKCSPCTLADEVTCLKNIFCDNGYPTHIVDRVIRQGLAKAVNETPPALVDGETEVPKEIYIRLPWIGPHSTTFRREIRQAIDKGFSNVKTMVLFTTQRAFSGRVKDVLPVTSQSSIVYMYTCRCARTYIGKTSQCLSERIKQHVPAKLLATPPVLRKTNADSAITCHLKQHPDCITADVRSRFTTLAKARNQRHLGVLEALFIRERAPDLCKQQEHVRTLLLV